ncbi:MAG: (2Fe-2S)-binding protein [Candidatus Tritonobacter lacicola]|nr:(2Fe-2S)-binding protein [Candidatus Tritonobacter lacicola]
MKTVNIEFTLNGAKTKVTVPANMTLVHLLRKELGLTGTKIGCDKGECGACAVLINGKSMNSCLVLAAQVDGKEVTTIEGLENEGKLHPIQEAFIEEGAIQCGYCTPGMVISAKFLLDRNPDPTDDEIKTGISGNLCRCTGYTKIVNAVRAAAQKLKNAGGGGETR